MEFKRQQLLLNLATVKADMMRAIGRLQGVVLDIEASKLDYGADERPLSDKKE